MMTVNGFLVELTCWSRDPICEVRFGIGESTYRRLAAGGATFFCPLGHRLCVGESTETKLRRQLDQAMAATARAQDVLETEIEDHRHTEHRRRATKGALTRTRLRAAHGKCLACSRKFPDLKAHMAEQHPGFGSERER